MRRISPTILCLVMLLVTPILTAAQQAVKPILRAALEKDSAIPGQPIVLSVTVLVPTWLPKAPEFPSFEIPNVMVRLPPRASRSTSERVGRENWFGVTRSYRLYPMLVGRFRIPPQPVTVTFADPETRAPVTVELRTQEVSFTGVAPSGAEDLNPFIAAESLTLEHQVDGEPDNLEPGDAFTRTVTARVTGMSPIFLPRLIPSFMTTGISAYPKEPIVTEEAEREGITGDRVESVTYVAEAGGRSSAPPIRLRWFNLRTQRVETTEAPGFEIISRGPPLPAPSTAIDWRTIGTWTIISGLLVVLVAAAAVRFWPRMTEWRQRQREEYLASEAFAFAQATAALRAHQFGETVRGVAVWSERLPLSFREHERLSDVLVPLGSAVYGREPQAPSNRQWADALTELRAIRRDHLARSSAARASVPLAPLNPRGEA